MIHNGWRPHYFILPMSFIPQTGLDPFRIVRCFPASVRSKRGRDGRECAANTAPAYERNGVSTPCRPRNLSCSILSLFECCFSRSRSSSRSIRRCSRVEDWPLNLASFADWRRSRDSLRPGRPGRPLRFHSCPRNCWPLPRHRRPRPRRRPMPLSWLQPETLQRECCF
jgi:hypothetical protein